MNDHTTRDAQHTPTDRELLELAAKAAGISHDGEAGSWLAGEGNCALLLAGTDQVWSPLADDGDALRLFTKLPFRELYVSEIGVTVSWQREGSQHGLKCDEYAGEHGNDLTAATRRAIVRAAAAIGKAMP